MLPVPNDFGNCYFTKFFIIVIVVVIIIIVNIRYLVLSSRYYW